MAEVVTAMNVYLLTVTLLICGYVYWFFKRTFKYWEKRNVPFLKPSIPFGDTLDLYLGKSTFGKVFADSYIEFRKRGLKHGGIFYLWKPVYIPVDEEIVKKIIISDAEYFPNHGLYISEKDDPLSAHLFNMEDGPWRTLRSKLPRAFTSAKMRKMFLIMVEISKTFNNVLDDFEQKGTGIEIKSLISRFTVDTISACAFGMDSDTLKGKNKELLFHGRQFFDNQWNLYRNTLVVTIPRNILQMFNFKLFKKSTDKYVKNMFENIKNYRTDNNIIKQDLVALLIKLMKKDENEKDFNGKMPMEPLNIQEFVTQMYLLFSAGFETSSSTQTFALYELAKNPDYQTKLRNEINTTLARHNNQLTYDAIMEMKYLEAFIDETLRLYPVFPILPRVCKADYKIPGTDVTLEKNTFVMVSNMGIQRDPTYYPEPEKFIPDRFLPENKHTRPFISNLPFGEGPRICVGKRFGLMQTKVGLVTMVKNYNITLNEKTEEGFQFSSWDLILKKKGDVWINLKKIPQN